MLRQSGRENVTLGENVLQFRKDGEKKDSQETNMGKNQKQERKNGR